MVGTCSFILLHTDMANRLKKSEILRSKKMIERLFQGGASSFSVFPLRVVYLPVEDIEETAAILVSVSKRRFKHAVDRNRVKRQIREAYRLNRHLMTETARKEGKKMIIAFIYLSDRKVESRTIAERMKTAMCRIAENIAVKPSEK